MQPRSQPLLTSLTLGLALLVAPAAMLVAPSPAACAPKAEHIALVDMQRVINETKAGKAGRAKLENSSKSKQAKFDKQRSALEAEAAKLGSLSGVELAAAQEKLQRESIELQNMLMQLEQELGEQHDALLQKMYVNAQGIVAGIAQSEDLDIVLIRDPMTVIFAKDAFDITAQVIAEYDRKHPG